MKRWSRHQFTRSFQPMSRRRPIVVTVTYWLRAHCAACQWIHGYMLKSNMGTPTCSPQSTLCHILWVVTNSWDSQEWRSLESVVEGRQYSIAGPSAPRCWSTICAQTAYRWYVSQGHRPIIMSTQVAADQGLFRIWRWVSLPEGGQKFWLQWQLADSASLAGACVAATWSAMDPFHWVICIRLIRWHGAHLQAVVIMMEEEQIAVNMWASKLRPVRVSVVNRSPSRRQGWLAAMPGSLQIFPN